MSAFYHFPGFFIVQVFVSELSAAGQRGYLAAVELRSFRLVLHPELLPFQVILLHVLFKLDVSPLLHHANVLFSPKIEVYGAYLGY